MGLFKSKEEKASERDARGEAFEQKGAPIEAAFAEAERAAEAGRLLEEEAAIRRAFLAADALHRSLNRADMDRLMSVWPTTYESGLRVRIETGQLRRGQTFLGSAGPIEIWTDRVLVHAESLRVWPLDHECRASVETAGQLTSSSRPTLTRMAAGAILPGSALIPGLVFQKKEVQDTRELYFIIEHPTYFETAPVQPDFEGTLRQVAASVNYAARSRSSVSAEPSEPQAPDQAAPSPPNLSSGEAQEGSLIVSSLPDPSKPVRHMANFAAANGIALAICSEASPSEEPVAPAAVAAMRKTVNDALEILPCRFDDLRPNTAQGLAEWLLSIGAGATYEVAAQEPPEAVEEGSGEPESEAPPELAAIGDDVPEQIRELGALRDDGLLTEAEFQEKKAELLRRM